jgi:membrane protein DedA with SNARE-associated domain
MTIESSFLPLPSEIVIPPYAYLAAKGEFNLILVILAGILGSILGALINYFLSITLGRTLVYAIVRTRWAKLILLNEKKLEDAENYFLQYGNFATFIGRLVPVVRHLISIPAGFCRMRLDLFILYTFLGSTVWVTILAFLGYYFGANQEMLSAYYHELTIAGFSLFILFMIYIARKSYRRKKNDKINASR